MFDVGKKYWFSVNTPFGISSVKGEVVEETPFLIRVRRDDGNHVVIICANIVNLNEAKIEATKIEAKEEGKS